MKQFVEIKSSVPFEITLNSDIKKGQLLGLHEFCHSQDVMMLKTTFFLPSSAAAAFAGMIDCLCVAVGVLKC